MAVGLREPTSVYTSAVCIQKLLTLPQPGHYKSNPDTVSIFSDEEAGTISGADQSVWTYRRADSVWRKAEGTY